MVRGGDAPTVLVVHGAMDRSSSFGRVAAHLPEATVLAYDRRGYGRSTRPPSEHFDDQADDLLEVIGDEPVIGLGHSFGGAVVLAAAARRPDLVRAAVVWEPPVPWLGSWRSGSAGQALIDQGGDPGDQAERFMRRMVGDRIWDHLPAATRSKRRAEGSSLVADLLALRRLGWVPEDVTVPVIVGHGAASRPHHRLGTAELVRRLPHASLVTVEGAEHGAHLSHAPALSDLVRSVVALAGEGDARPRVGTVGRPVGGGAESGGQPDPPAPAMA